MGVLAGSVIKCVDNRFQRWGVVSFADSLDRVGIIGKDVASTSKVFDLLYYDTSFLSAFFFHWSSKTFSLSLRRGIPPPLGQRPSKKFGSCARSTWLNGRPRVQEHLGIFASEPLKYVHNSLVSPFDPHTPSTSQEYFPASLDSSFISPLRRVVRALKDCGATLLLVSLPNTSYALSIYYATPSTEASSNLARYDGVQFGLHVPLLADAMARSPDEVYAHSCTAGFGSEVKRWILLGTYDLTAEYATHTLLPRNITSDRMMSLAARSTTTFFCKPSAYASASVTTLCASFACPTRPCAQLLRTILACMSFCTRRLFA